ncbi:Pimeloyl-ACP methyl ester carboxylesterase [Sphingomonas sp. YR710]|uniref:alpha/beta fold hydrolase n=1 Tax=Sphingomonas sp. YR710 TaxID=1882773 RepID=UPI0008894965|nr:alpha/beta hydrolase [Sphingomonas sp. YR710]SDC82710.1 Pimeloyl-ACP methyl ester carboxylesterase [Sphingomonas sp. YR710]
MTTLIDRAFVRIAEGLIHMRRIDGGRIDAPPLVMIHLSPGSSRGLEGLMTAIAARGGRTLIAPDTVGNGDSAPPAPSLPDIAYYADTLARLLEAMGLDRVDLYGTHTGARIACEMAVLHPDRLRRVIIDGIIEYAPDAIAEMIEHYAPQIAPDDYGCQFAWAFNFVRDQALHFPWYKRDPAHRLMSYAVPSADELHAKTLEVLKSLRTYHKSYRAAFAYRASERLPLVALPTLFLIGATELPAIRDRASDYAAMVAESRIDIVGPTVEDKAVAIQRFLEA